MISRIGPGPGTGLVMENIVPHDPNSTNNPKRSFPFRECQPRHKKLGISRHPDRVTPNRGERILSRPIKLGPLPDSRRCNVSASNSATISEPNSRAFATIGMAGLIAGTMDITAAFLTWYSRGIMPVRILQGIASALIGPKSFSMGMETAALGLALHFLIAFTAASVFYAASRKSASCSISQFQPASSTASSFT